MATEDLQGTPFGIPEAAGVGGVVTGTLPEDMQRIIATMFEYHPKSGGGTTRAGIYRGCDIELRPDTTVRVHDGSIVYDMGNNLCAWGPIEYIPSLDIPLAKGTAGTVTIYAEPIYAATNNSRVVAVKGTTVPSNAVRLERLDFGSGWATTSQATRNLDYDHAALQGTTHGILVNATDSGNEFRFQGNKYRRLDRKFSVPTDSAISVRLGSTIYSAWEDGTGANHPLSFGITGSVIYEVWIDGVMRSSRERTISGYSDTHEWTFDFDVATGDHQIWVVSYGGASASPQVGGDNVHWRVRHGGFRNHPGDTLTVKHEGVRR